MQMMRPRYIYTIDKHPMGRTCAAIKSSQHRDSVYARQCPNAFGYKDVMRASVDQ